LRSSAIIPNIAVKPAIPTAIACIALIPSGNIHEGIGKQSRKLAVPAPDGLSKSLPSYEDLVPDFELARV